MTNSLTSGKPLFARFSGSFAKKDIRKVESAFLLALLLLPGILIALPALSLNVNATTGVAPAAITGASAAIDYPILANVQASPTADTRVINVTNPTGNYGITSITISNVQAGSLSAAPTGSIPSWGGVSQCSAGCTANVYGSGPFSVIYQDGANPHGVILPPGATIQLVIGLTPETATQATGAADAYSLAVQVTDTSGANTVLSSIPIYETSSAVITATNPASTAETAGSSFTFTASTVQSGLPLSVSVATGTASTTTVSPSSFTSGSSAQTVTVSDTTADASLTLTVDATNMKNSHSAGGFMTAGTAGPFAVSAAAVTTLTVTINGHAPSASAAHPYTYQNETAKSLIAPANIQVSTTDKYGNAAVFSATNPTTVTLSTTTLKGSAAGFTVAGYSTAYPFTPSDLVYSITVTIPANTASVLLSTATTTPLSHPSFYFGPDYGSQSEIVATANGLSQGVSSILVTQAFQTTQPTLYVQNGAANGVCTAACGFTAGTPATIEAVLPIAQAGVTVYFWISTNTTDYAGLFGNSMRAVSAVTTANSSATSGASWPCGTTGCAVATVTLSGDTVTNDQATVVARYLATPTTNSSTTDAAHLAIVSVSTGTFASLVVKTYFDSAQANAAKNAVSGATLYVDAVMADAYGNTITLNTAQPVQVTVTTSAGSLSATSVYITNGNAGIKASGYQVQFTAPTSGSATITASASYSGVSASGSKTITIVSKVPTLALTSVPTAVTAGTPQTIKGWANVSLGAICTSSSCATLNTISTLEYSLNGKTNVTIGAGQATNQFTISTLLASGQNTLTVYAEDAKGVWTSQTVQIPQVTVDHTFTFSSTPSSATIGTYKAINATVTNNSPQSLTAVVFAVVMNSANQTVAIDTATVVVGSGSTASAFPILTGLPSGTYTVQVFVLTTSGVSVSPQSTITVTI